MSLAKHKFYNGLARSSLTFGVPIEIFGLILCISGIGFIATTSFYSLLLGFPLWLISFLICIKDPGLLNVYYVRLTMIPIVSKNKFFWNSRSYQP